MFYSPFIRKPVSVSQIMLRVILALLPGLAAYVWFFGPMVLVSIALASVTALATEAVLLKLRNRPVAPFLQDNSALLTAWLIALSIPAFAPWWLVVVGTAFAIVIAKQLYGGLGSNPFNPAMIAYAVLIISFPTHMTHWIAPTGVPHTDLSFAAQLGYAFSNVLPDGVKLDAVTMATPLDTLKTQLHLGQSMSNIFHQPIFSHFGGHGGEMVAAGFLLGGLYLLAAGIISWHLPLMYLACLAGIAQVFHWFDPSHYAGATFHLFSGAAMLGAFFILTDPVTSPTTHKGKFIFAAGAALLTYLIRVFGGFPDGVAFATLLMNICVPLIDAYTQPTIFGHKEGAK